jgi:uncharacterized membrane protein YgdD (TMEM256/DUF423 family)
MKAARNLQANSSIIYGAVLAGLAVGLGAFGAHAMKEHYDASALLTFETGVRYQMFHGLALLASGIMQAQGIQTRVASTLFLMGTILFSGSLYGLVLLQATWMGPITPIGGVLFLAGWTALAIASRKQP